MNASFQEFGFYYIDIDYLHYLYSIDSEVQFSIDKCYNHKPFLGIVAFIGGRDYFVPLTSAKGRHSKWKNVGAAHYLIYETVEKRELRENDIFKSISDSQALKIIAALDIRKMIPVKRSLYHRVDFSMLEDAKYVDLLEKEYRFCLKIQDGILSKASRVYEDQEKTGVVHPIYCNYKKLEAASDAYQSVAGINL